MNTFTVIGFYRDSLQRFADNFDGSDADVAEAVAVALHPALVVCGVIAGEHSTSDTATMVIL